jgi:metallo-beta-lactamase family protein
MLLDAAKLQVEDAAFANRSKYSHHNRALPLYDEQDALESLKWLYEVPYHHWQDLVGLQKKDGFSFCFKLRAF